MHQAEQLYAQLTRRIGEEIVTKLLRIREYNILLPCNSTLTFMMELLIIKAGV